MRTFHIFNIDKSIAFLTKNDTYQLYNTFKRIKSLNSSNLSLGINLYEQVASPIKKDKYNKYLFKSYADSDFYYKFKNNHTYYNKYRNEESHLRVGSAFLKIESNVSNPDFFKYLKRDHNLFVCDFDNCDYFWLDTI